MPITVVQGLQRGDEGKGRFVDMLAAEHDIVARYNGGHNAGHTVITPDGRVLRLHLVPSGITYPHTVNVIGNGTVVDPLKLVNEIESVEAQGFGVTPDNLLISSGAHLVTPEYISEDEIREASAGRQGSTKSGIAQSYGAKAMREGLRAEAFNNNEDQLLDFVAVGIARQKERREKYGLEPLSESLVGEYQTAIRKLGGFVTDTVLYLNSRLGGDSPARVLAEGAQAFLLDIDHGMYPYVTSSATGIGGVINGLGVPAQEIDRVIGVVKAVQSHVGGGPFVTEIKDEELLRQLHGDMNTEDAEKGATTGRVRRLGNLDIPELRRAIMINRPTEIAITKLDWVSRFGEFVKICTAYERKGKTLTIAPDAAYKLEQSTPLYEELPLWSEDIQDIRHFKDLPKDAQSYVKFIIGATAVETTMLGVGPSREQVILR